MTEVEAAKNALLDKTCDTCIFATNTNCDSMSNNRTNNKYNTCTEWMHPVPISRATIFDTDYSKLPK